MSEFGMPMLYHDQDEDLSLLRERLLDSILNLPETCFFRVMPKITSEVLFESNGAVVHRAGYRCSEIKGMLDEVVGL